MIFLAACIAESPPVVETPPTPVVETPAPVVETPRVEGLTWVDGRRICALGVERLEGDDGQFEASGLTVADGRLWVAFDNSGRLLSLAPDLTDAQLTATPRRGDHEAITAAGERLLIADEPGSVVPFVDGAYGDPEPIAVALKDKKGIEGLAWADCQQTLLALCEDGCKAGPLLALTEDDGGWSAASVPLPVALKDYAGLALHAEGACPSAYTLAVLSQKSAAIWIGSLAFAEGRWQAGEGAVLPLPRDADGRKIYTTAEGVAFLSADRLAVVTDAEDDQPPCGRADRPPSDAAHADQSVHIFQR